MDTELHPRCCPSCGHRFIPWGSWRISQWSCLRCPSCDVRLNRRRDAQLFLLFIVGMVLIASLVALVFTGFPIVGVIALIVLTVVLVWVVDCLPVRLVVAGRWRGLRGYEV